MENDIRIRIEELITKVRFKYPKLSIGYKYNDECYLIWHNDSNLEYGDEEFRNFTGKLLNEYFFNHDIFNVYMTYDSGKSQEEYYNGNLTENKISISYQDLGISTVPLEIHQSDIRESILYSNNSKCNNFEIKYRAEVKEVKNEFKETFSRAA